jgi:hypothetical protein
MPVANRGIGISPERSKVFDNVAIVGMAVSA